MIKAGREFEEAVYTFAKALDPTAYILFDHNVRDRDTGKSRQCDVWINAKFGGHWPVSILVSCKDHSRKLHVGDIGAFCDEVRSTGASTGVIYSRVGFTKPALDKARANGLACCKIYRNEPSDVPLSIWFDQFACKPTIELVLASKLNNAKYTTWNNIFDITTQSEQGVTTILDEISTVYDRGEEWSINESKKNKAQTPKLFPPDWCSELHFNDDDIVAEIKIRVIGRWKGYRARVEATLLNGSYCFSDGSYKGDIIGPAIDTQGEHFGEAWTEIVETDSVLPLNRLMFIIYKPDIKKTLREGFGSEAPF